MGKHTRGKTLKTATTSARSHAQLLTPSLAQRISRLNPSERHEVEAILRALKLRKTIRATLHTSFINGQLALARSSTTPASLPTPVSAAALPSIESYAVTET